MIAHRTDHSKLRWAILLAWVGFLFFNIVIWYETRDIFSSFLVGFGLGIIFIMSMDNLLFDSSERLINSYEVLKITSDRLIKLLMEKNGNL